MKEDKRRGSHGPLSAEHKKKIGDANRGKERSPELRARISKALTGKPLSEATKHKLSLALTGKKRPFRKRGPLSEEHKQKIGDANRGHAVSEEQRKQISDKLSGTKQTLERRQRQSIQELGTQKKPRKNPKGAARGYDCSPEELGIRREARERGDMYYIYPEPCPQGHVSERRVKSGMCRKCEAEFGMKKYRERVEADPTFIMYNMARTRARVQGIPFEVTRDDVRGLWPEDGLCPVLGIKLESNLGKMGNQAQSPTLDKFVPSMGYIPGNVAVISKKANAIKSDATNPEVFKRMAEWLKHGCLVGNYDVPKKYIQQKLMGAKNRAKEQGVPFDLTVEDILAVWPSDNKCPILNVELRVAKGVLGPSSNSPALDKINPKLGYVRGNVAVISSRANLMKQDEYTPQPFLKMAKWLESQGVIDESN